MNPLVQAYLEKQVKRAQRLELEILARDLREQQKKLEPLRRKYRENLKRGVKGDGFVMKTELA